MAHGRRADDPQAQDSGLRRELLRLDQPMPPRLRLLWDVRMRSEPEVRLFEVLPASSP